MKILIKSDVYNISKRIKYFDKNYRIFYDADIGKYQIYSSECNNGFQLINKQKFCYICTLPNNELDARALDYLFATRVENMQEIIDNIEKTNIALEKENNTKIKNQALSVAEQKMRQLAK